jgi:hypothetical protein
MSGRARTATVAALAVLAVSFAAATLDSTVAPESGGAGAETGSGAGGPSIPLAPPPGEPFEISFPTELLGGLVVLGILAALAYAYYRQRRELLVALVGAMVLVGVFGLLFALVFAPGGQIGSAAVGNASGGGVPPEGGGAPDGTVPAPLSLPLLVGLLVAIVAVGIAVTRTRGGDEARAESDADEEERGRDAAAVGRAAGRAADRIEGEETVENEVYRAWREMTALLDVDAPETNTPGEFADAAVDAGLGREDVTELTRLFEDVRYGDRDPAEGEERAVAVLRRIESRYAEDEP